MARKKLLKASKKPTKKQKAKKPTYKKHQVLGWKTTDEDEIALRRDRGVLEPMRINRSEPKHPYFSNFVLHSNSGRQYQVEIRSLLDRTNSCDCPDFQGNQLGTCKHIEHVLWRLEKRGKRQFKQVGTKGSTRIEIYLDHRQPANNAPIKVQSPPRARNSKASRLLAPFFSANHTLLGAANMAWPALQRAINEAPASVRAKIRVSKHIDRPIQYQIRAYEKQQAKQAFLSDVAEGKRSLNVVKQTLYPYQQQGMLHLAFTERALLADEMGLGKTVQAIAACELLRRLHGIGRVLIVATASLKAEWEAQITKFIGLPSLIIEGSRTQRLAQYQHPGFFYITNYEQIMRDHEDIQRVLAPDIIILDEAQRIKNWRTKTALAVKQLSSRYAFVLTGTPIENRIDDIYSIVQFLDPHVFGPLFRFNREFYQLDDKGKPIGYQQLDKLHQQLHPILLHRRKSDVETELPERVDKHYFVSMDDEQRTRYEEYETKMARLAATAKKRPLSPDEFKRLQLYLACMRMLCDSPYILDKACRISPKIKELSNILIELTSDPKNKIIIFSEWTRMLELVEALSNHLNLKYALHTGSVNQKKRRNEINRFKENPDCRLFLSSDAGSVGINLQAANVVINLDLPWNPAKLEQRIARAWRKHQKNTVTVIHLICEHSIEHRMLSLLNQKQHMAIGVLQGLEEHKSMPLPSGRAVLLEQVNQLLAKDDTASPHAIKPLSDSAPNVLECFQQDVLARFSGCLERLEVYQSNTGEQTVFAVVDDDSNQPSTYMQDALALQDIGLEVIDQSTFDLISRLAKAGVLTLNPTCQRLHATPGHHKATTQPSIPAHWIEAANQHQQQADRPLNMATCLINGAFFIESLPAMKSAFDLMVSAFAWLVGKGEHCNKNITPEWLETVLIQPHGLPNEAQFVCKALSIEDAPIDAEQCAKQSLSNIQSLAKHIKKRLRAASL